MDGGDPGYRHLMNEYQTQIDDGMLKTALTSTAQID